MPMTYSHNYRRAGLFVGAIACLCLLTSPAWSETLSDGELQDLIDAKTSGNKHLSEINNQIEEQAVEIASISERIDTYEEAIEQRQAEATSLENQLASLDDSILANEESIDRTAAEKEQTQLEMDFLNEEIRIKKEQIVDGRRQLSSLLREVYFQDARGSFEVVFGYNSLADFFSELEHTERLQADVGTAVERLGRVEASLQDKKSEVADKNIELQKKSDQLAIEQEQLSGQVQSKENILEQTKADETKYATLVASAQEDQRAVESQIASLRSKAQSKIETIRQDIIARLDQGDTTVTEAEQNLANGITVLQWPNAYRYISCSFHCGGYPFAGIIGAHSGIDIPMPHGTPIYAAASGYVSIARSDNTTRFAFILVDHGNISTMYGHVSGISAAADSYVRQGDLLGYSGGTPGTPGSGLSTGAHLHFEVRKDNTIPVDPFDYLP